MSTPKARTGANGMQYAMVPPLDPKRYYSPSGRYALFVDPSSPTGSGSAFYRLTLSGKTIWERTHPFTLREAGVTDTGIVGGYGYSQGLEGWAKNPGPRLGYGTLDRVILNPTGQVILYQKTTRQPGRIGHGHPDPKEGKVREVDRTADILPRGATSTGSKLNLTVRGRIALKVPSKDTPSPIQNIWTIATAGAGRFAFLRNSEPPAIVVISEAGKLVKTISLAGVLLAEERAMFLLTRSDSNLIIFTERDLKPRGTMGRAIVVNIPTGKLAPLTKFQATYIRSVAAFADGGFAVLESVQEKYTSTQKLTRWDIQGKKRWEKVKDGYTGNPAELFAPEAVTVLKGGTIAVLDNIANNVQFFNSHGKFLRFISLEKAWKQPAQLSCGYYRHSRWWVCCA
ncbi:MAG: hypothetical protein QM758_25215 [Armatimonas sp.]